MTDDTSIRIKVDTWRRLREHKGPGESFDDAVNKVLNGGELDAHEQAEN